MVWWRAPRATAAARCARLACGGPRRRVRRTCLLAAPQLLAVGLEVLLGLVELVVVFRPGIIEGGRGGRVCQADRSDGAVASAPRSHAKAASQAAPAAVAPARLVRHRRQLHSIMTRAAGPHSAAAAGRRRVLARCCLEGGDGSKSLSGSGRCALPRTGRSLLALDPVAAAADRRVVRVMLLGQPPAEGAQRGGGEGGVGSTARGFDGMHDQLCRSLSVRRLGSCAVRKPQPTTCWQPACQASLGRQRGCPARGFSGV